MKRWFGVVLVVLCCSACPAQQPVDVQDLVLSFTKEIQKLTLEADSLKKVVAVERRKSDSMKTNLSEMVKQNQQTFSVEKDSMMRDFKSKTRFYTDSLGRLNKKYADSEKAANGWKDKYEKEKKKTVRLPALETRVAELEAKNDTLSQELVVKEQTRYAEGVMAVVKQIEFFYEKSLDEISGDLYLQMLSRDLNIAKDTRIRQKMLDLQLVLSAQKVLKEKYNSLKVDDMREKIKSLQYSEEVKSLDEKLKLYGTCYESLGKAIEKIQQIDKEFDANSESTEKKKIEQIMGVLSYYIYNYKYMDYPYLLERVLEILVRKQRDANADISDIKRKLE